MSLSGILPKTPGLLQTTPVPQPAVLLLPGYVLGLAFMVAMLTTYSFVPRIVPDVGSNYNYIIVGAGSSGSVLAYRLSENPSVRVLVLEAGEQASDFMDVPGNFGLGLLGFNMWPFYTTPQQNACMALNNQQSRWHRGLALGGSSAVNAMLIARGNREDYDRWAANGCDGWGYNDALPYFKRSENNTITSINGNGYHGTSGPLTVQYAPYHTQLNLAFLAAGTSMGYSIIDYNGPTQMGFSTPQSSIRDGRRCSTSKAYLYAARDRQNLDIVTNAYVTRVLFNNTTAIGVEYVRGLLSYLYSYLTQPLPVLGSLLLQTVQCSTEVIVSAGAIMSPHILMHSGIGHADLLQPLQIPVIADLPVGDNLQDHIGTGSLQVLMDVDGGATPQKKYQPQNCASYTENGTGPLTLNGDIDGLAFIHTNLTNQPITSPDLEVIFVASAIGTNGEGTQLSLNIKETVWTEYFFRAEIQNSYLFATYPVLLHPKSRGEIRLLSNNPFQLPFMDPKYLSQPDDVNVLIEGAKFCLNLISQPSFQRFGSRIDNFPFPGCETFTQWSDEYLECIVRSVIITMWHPVGTCKMGAISDPTTVLDPRLRVKGISKLRVVDCSSMPDLIAGHTNAPAIMMGEKAADMIRCDHGETQFC